MLWYSALEREAGWGSGRVGSGRWSEILEGSLLERFSGAGDWPVGDWREDVVGVCNGVKSLLFFSAG